MRKFVELFAKDLYTAETGKPVSKRFEDKTWPELKKILRLCEKFDSTDEPILEETHNFTSPYLHTDGTVPTKVPSPSQLNPHYSAMNTLFEKYKALLGLS